MPYPVSQHFTWMEHLLTASLRKHFTHLPSHWGSLSHKAWFEPTRSICTGVISHCWEPLSHRPCVWLTEHLPCTGSRAWFLLPFTAIENHQCLPLSHKEGGEIICKTAPHQPGIPFRPKKTLSTPPPWLQPAGWGRWQEMVAKCSSSAILTHNK